MTTVSTILNAAIRQLGITNPSATQLSNCMTALNMMLYDWATTPGGVYKVTRESFSTVSGTASYTMGSGATFDTTKPVRITNAYITDNSTDYPIEIISADDYARISLKSTSARPYNLYQEHDDTQDVIFLYPTPDAVYTLNLWSRKPLGAYTSTSDTLTLPPEYEPALKYNLAIVYAPELAVQPYQSTVIMATKTLRNLKRLNTSPAPRISTDPLNTNSSSFDINSGLYL